VYLAKSVVERNQIMKTAGTTVFERIHCFKALTVGDIMEEVADGTDEGYNDTVVPMLRERMREMIATYQAHNNERNFVASFSRDSEVQFKSKQEQEFKRGDSVTWINKRKNAESGKVVTVKYEGGVPVSALIDIGGQRKKIQYNALKEKSAKRPQLLLGLSVRISIGSMAFWRDDAGALVGAKIVEQIEDQLLVHYYMENESRRKWLPLWQEDGAEDCLRREKCPEGYSAAEEVIPATTVELTGSLKETYFIDEGTLLKIEAWLQE
jgi:hypothetical protein